MLRSRRLRAVGLGMASSEAIIADGIVGGRVLVFAIAQIVVVGILIDSIDCLPRSLGCTIRVNLIVELGAGAGEVVAWQMHFDR